MWAGEVTADTSLGGLRVRPVRRRSKTVLGMLASLVVLVGLVSPAPANAVSSDQAVAYQLDPAHDGDQTASPITTPLTQAWSVNLGGAISYPLVVNGIVYAIAAASGGGTTLYALDQASGATLWSHGLGGPDPWSGLAYDAGQVFTVNGGGILTAFNASTGAINWSVNLPGQTSFDSPPTASNGYVYTGGSGSGGTVYAVYEATGALAWSQPVENGDISSPAVDANGVYVTNACDQDYDFNPLTGALIWHHSTGCEGGGGKVPVLANGDVFSRDAVSGNVILSAASGSTQGSFNSTPAPAVGGGTAYTVGGGALTAVDDSGLGSNQWTFTGDGKLDTAPLIVGNLVFEGSSGGNLYAINASTGASAWSTSLPSGVPGPGEQNVSQPLAGLGAGEGTLVVPTGSTLTAFAGANVGSGTPADSSAPAVAGSPVVGAPVGADVGTWTGLPTSYTYQWKDCSSGTCSNIQGATGESYTPTSTELGHTLEVSVSATNGSGSSSAVTSGPSAAIASPPMNSAIPQISGSAAYGHVLTASTGSWTPPATSYAYQWLRCQNSTCTPEAGATSSSHTVAAGDVGSQLEVQVTAVNGAGANSATSQPTSTVATVATMLTLLATPNPVTVGNALNVTATISPGVDGGTVTFTEDGQPLSWCEDLAVTTSSWSVTCGGTAVSAGTILIGATYSGDSAFDASSSSLTERIVNAQSASPLAVPPGVTISGAPTGTTTSPTVYYSESGDITWTICTVDGGLVPCDSTHAALSRLRPGSHTFTVQVLGAAGTAHASVTWTVVPPLSAPTRLRARRMKGGIWLSWGSVRGAHAYAVIVLIGRRGHTDNLSGSARGMKLRLRRGQHARVTVRAVGGSGRGGTTATISVT